MKTSDSIHAAPSHSALASPSMFGSIHARVHQQASLNPNAIAVTAGSSSLTYAQLNTASNQLSSQLRSFGVHEGSHVVACLDRSALFIVAMLAVHKAGAVFVPLSGEYPASQQRKMIAQVQSPVVLTDNTYETHCSTFSESVINLETRHLTSQCPTSSSSSDSCDSYQTDAFCDIAFVLFTSGSTGVPKGVLQTHASYVNQSAMHKDQLGYDTKARVLLFGALGHGNAIVSIVSTLCNGGTVCIETHERTIPGLALATTLLKLRISHIHLPPSSLAVLPVRDYPHIRALSVGGEMLSTHLVQTWKARVPLFHAYGTTETNWMLVQQLNQVKNLHSDLPIPVGYPVGNMRAEVVDENGYPVLNGAIGELRAEGIGISPGYIASADETRSKFSDDAWQSGNRWYMTGDLASRNDDGLITLHGRADDQVKIRGFRVELQMVQHAIQSHQSVQAVATIVETTGHEQRLIAFIVPSESIVDLHQLRHDLKVTLPAHMIPHQFHLVSHIPLLPNGKCDRAQLKRSQWQSGGQSGAAVSNNSVARNDDQCPIEAWLIQAWHNILQTPAELTDDFFSLGGDSLLAGSLLVAVDNKFAVEISARQFFDSPTIEQLAQQIRSGIS